MAEATGTVERLRGLLAVARLVNAGVRGDELLAAVAETVARAFGFGTVVVNLYRPVEHDFQVATVCGNDDARDALLGTSLSFERWTSLLDERFQVEGAFFVPAGAFDWSGSDAFAFIPEMAGSDDVRAWNPHDALFVPLRRSDGQLIGILSVDEPASGLRPGRDDMAVLAGAAAHLAQALESAEARHVNDRLVAQVRDAERRYRSLVEQLPAVVYRSECGRAGRWLYVSPQISLLLGFSAEEWLADPGLWLSRVHQNDRGQLGSHRERACRDGKPLSCHYRIFARDGREVWIRDEAIVLQEDEGWVVQGVLSDITAQKQAEEAIVSASAAKTEFLARVSHELRNPVVAILGWMELMRERPELSQSEAVEMVLGSAHQIEGLISGLLDAAAAESGRFAVQPQPTNPQALLEEVRAALSAAAQLRKVTLSREAEGAPSVVTIDPDRVRQVIYNLVSNALKHAPPGSTVTLRAAADSAGVRFEVADEGPGIAADDQADLFQPYVRLAGAPSGTGLGLAVAREIVEAHGGQIGVDSALGAGATFWMRLPARTAGLPGTSGGDGVGATALRTHPRA